MLPRDTAITAAVADERTARDAAITTAVAAERTVRDTVLDDVLAQQGFALTRVDSYHVFLCHDATRDYICPDGGGE